MDEFATEGAREISAGFSSPLGMAIIEGPHETCGQSCYRLRWRWASIISILGLILLIVSILIGVSRPGSPEEKQVALILFFVALAIVILPIATVGVLRRIHTMRYGRGDSFSSSSEMSPSTTPRPVNTEDMEEEKKEEEGPEDDFDLGRAL